MSAHFSTRMVLLALLLSISGKARAELLPIKTYTSEDGLAHNRVQSIVRDSQGFLRFCTTNGLSRFDGQNFFTFGLEEGLAFSIFLMPPDFVGNKGPC